MWSSNQWTAKGILWYSHFKTPSASSSKSKYRVTIWPSNSQEKWKHAQQKHVYKCAQQYYYSGQKFEAIQMIISWWVSKQNAYRTRYFSAIERTEVLIHATMWMNLENILLREEAASQKGPHSICYVCVLLNICMWKPWCPIWWVKRWGFGLWGHEERPPHGGIRSLIKETKKKIPSAMWGYNKQSATRKRTAIWPCWTWTSGIQNCEKHIFAVLEVT